MFPTVCPACKHRSLAVENDYLVCQNCDVYRSPLAWWQKPLAWARQRPWGWWWRVLVVLWFVAMLIQNLHDPKFALNRMSNPFSALDLGIHELGHMIFSPFGAFLQILGGSLFQCLFPLLWIAGFLQIRWYFATTLCFGWLGLNLFDVATYAADARARLLPLATGPFGIGEPDTDETYNQGHDWYQLLSRTHHLSWDLAIARGLRIAAVVMFVATFVLAGLLLAEMIRSLAQRYGAPPASTETPDAVA
jgi:hypothetical protein